MSDEIDFPSLWRVFWQRINGNKDVCILSISDVNIFQPSMTACFSYYSNTDMLDGSRSVWSISWRWSIQKSVPLHYENDSKILLGIPK